MEWLFYLASTARGGGTKAFFELANHLSDQGHSLEVCSPAPRPDWFPLRVPFRQAPDLPVSAESPRQVVVSHLYQIPWIWSQAPGATLLWFCLGYDGYALTRRAGSIGQEDAATLEALRLPVEAVTYSRSVRQTLEEKGKSCHLIPWSIDGALYSQRPPASPGPGYRIAMVADPEIPLKGFDDAWQAFRQVRLPVTLVLVTRSLSWHPPSSEIPVEIHRRPSSHEIPDILASCHVLCCSSWYEGLGRPALEAMGLGLPVVSTRNLGVNDYAREEENVLLAEVGRSDQLAAQLHRVLTQPALAQRLRQGGLETVRLRGDWSVTAAAFARVCQSCRWNACPPGLDAQGLLARLCKAGHYTPAAWVQEQKRNYHELLKLSKPGDNPHRIEQLLDLRERIRARLATGHPVFQAQFDACQLLLAFPQQRLPLGSPVCP